MLYLHINPRCYPYFIEDEKKDSIAPGEICNFASPLTKHTACTQQREQKAEVLLASGVRGQNLEMIE